MNDSGNLSSDFVFDPCESPSLVAALRQLLDPPSHPGILGNLDHFEALSVIGEGTLGITLRTWNVDRTHYIAIKCIKPELVEEPMLAQRFLTAAQRMEHLSHPNILRARDVSDRPRGCYFVMPFLSRGNLAMLLKTGPPPDDATVINLSRQIATGLHFAHGKGIAHGNLKPENVLFEPDGPIRLSDFGLGLHDSVSPIAPTKVPEHLRCVTYAAPEVVAGKESDAISDIFSFGALLYEMLTGRPPYQGRTLTEALEQVAAGPPQPVLDINFAAPPGLAAVAGAAMVRNRNERYTTMADILADLERVAKGRYPLGPQSPVPGPRPSGNTAWLRLKR